MIVVGGGAQDAGEDIARIAEMLEAPVMTGRMGQGVIDGRHRLSITMPAGYLFWGEADVVLAVGTRLQPQQQRASTTRSRSSASTSTARSSTASAGQEHQDHRRRRGAGPHRLGDLCRPSLRDGRAEHVAEVKARANKAVRDKLAPQVAYLEAIRKALPEDGILVDELTQMGYVARLAWPTYKPRTLPVDRLPGHAGLGLCHLARRQGRGAATPVVSINGDGGFMFTAMEMATAAQHGIGVVAVVFRPRLRRTSSASSSSPSATAPVASDLRNPDFVKLGESFGLHTERVKSSEMLSTAISRGIAAAARC